MGIGALRLRKLIQLKPKYEHRHALHFAFLPMAFALLFHHFNVSAPQSMRPERRAISHSSRSPVQTPGYSRARLRRTLARPARAHSFAARPVPQLVLAVVLCIGYWGADRVVLTLLRCRPALPALSCVARAVPRRTTQGARLLWRVQTHE